jgi:hypothetical protein
MRVVGRDDFLCSARARLTFACDQPDQIRLQPPQGERPPVNGEQLFGRKRTARKLPGQLGTTAEFRSLHLGYAVPTWLQH